MIFDFQLIASIGAVIWLIILSVLVWKSYTRYNKMTETFNERSAVAFLEKLLKGQEADRRDIAALLNRVAGLEKDSIRHLQKIGLIRFNPFKDTGGDQSFVLAVLDAHDTGIVLSGLYSRSGTRWYAKRVERGKGVEHELSEEEKKAVAIAK